jgi:hypothetical protein
MWFLLYHVNNHYNSIRSPVNPPRPTRHIPNVKRYQANLQSALDDYHDNYAQLVSSSIVDNTPIPPHNLGSIWEITCSIMPYIAVQLLEAGREAILEDQIADLCTQAEGRTMKWASTASTTSPSASTPVPNASSPAQAPVMQDEPDLEVQPPIKQKSSLKVSKFFPVFSTPSHRTESIKVDLDNNDDDPGIYSKTIDGVGDGSYLITASFIKTKDKIRDQLFINFAHFSDLMCTNIDGLAIQPISTNKPLPILTSAKDANMPITGTKVRDYFFLQNHVSLIPGTRNKPKQTSQEVDADGCFQFDGKRQFEGSNRITGIMLISTPGNVEDAINNLLIELEGDAHQIRYKPTQQKNSKAKKMFPGVPAGLCPEGIMHSVWHGLKKCEKTLCNAKKFTIKANMDCYCLPLPVMNGCFKQVTPPKATSDLESWGHSLNKLTKFKKYGCKMFVIEYNPIGNHQMAPLWDL